MTFFIKVGYSDPDFVRGKLSGVFNRFHRWPLLVWRLIEAEVQNCIMVSFFSQKQEVIGYPLRDNNIRERNHTLSNICRFLSASPTISWNFYILAHLAAEFSTSLLRHDLYSLSYYNQQAITRQPVSSRFKPKS